MASIRKMSLLFAVVVLAAAMGAAARATAQCCDECGRPCCTDCTDSTPLWRVRGEYAFFWWRQDDPLPPLVTTSPGGTARTDAGVLGTPGVLTLFGDTRTEQGGPGARLTVTRWLESVEGAGLEFVGFTVSDDFDSGNFDRQSSGAAILARPFFNATSNLEDAELVAFPDVLAGRVSVASNSEISSLAALVRYNWGETLGGQIDVIGGYRYFRFREDLMIRENLTSIDPGGLIPLGTTTDLFDRFAVGNDFHGAEFGLTGEWGGPNVSVELVAKLAVGEVFRTADIRGETVVTIPGTPAARTPGGLLALPSNIGARSDNKLAVLPELGVNGSFALSDNVSFVFGYSLVLLYDVIRASDQIDRVVNTSQIGGQPLAGPARPAFAFQQSELVLQGMNLGLDFRW